ncbi:MULTISPECIES: porin [Bartonella]|uniref:porin n=1 Tax=Bartonella TaxID=773 RepID=UPI0018DEC598|nr:MULTISPECIES: porin [Bartonella]MBH9994764.1 porin [Bartonella sp. P0291]MBH9996891.1 porin [Bartonella sp. M0192]MBH9999051.1 porin [Bartonella sp. M0191]MBI0007431.1 porin [Bartonella sp. M0193]MBI0010342.1 porin [Bartonella sp. M0176]
MNIKSLLLGSAAALIAVSGARAADVVVAEPEPVEYVRVCDAYGEGYFYIPGTETCMRISGYVRADIKGGDNVYARKRGDIDRDTYAWRTRATLRFHTASETELGTLRTFVELRSQWDEGAEWDEKGDTASGQLHFAFIELGGIRVGLDESIFHHWTGYYGNVINDDVLNPMAYSRTNVISYTFNAGNGFSAILGVEQGNSDADGYGYRYHNDYADIANVKGHKLSSKIDDYTPNVVGGLKFVQGWGGVSVVGAYDAYYEEWAAKARLDLNVTDQWSVWVMGGYKSADDYYDRDDTYGYESNSSTRTRNGLTKIGVYRQVNSIYGDWGGDWAVWGGTTFKFNKKTSFNAQVAYDDTDTFAASVNVKYELVPGLVITPELSYISWENDYSARNAANTEKVVDSLKGQDAFQGMLRIQRSF